MCQYYKYTCTPHILTNLFLFIQLLESAIPTTTSTPASQKASSGDISGTKRGIIDPLVSNQPEKILNKKIQKRKKERKG